MIIGSTIGKGDNMMDKLNDILHELGISKVKLAKYLGVSRQMIYNYLDMDDINKWPKDKKVLLLNLLGIKSAEEIDSIKVDTDYIMNVENRINNLFQNNVRTDISDSNLYTGLGKKQKELLANLVEIIKDGLEDDDNTNVGLNTYTYLYHFLQSLNSSKETRYILAYISKACGFTGPMEFAFDEEQQFIFESIMFSAMTLYNNRDSASAERLAASHKKFEEKITAKKEEMLNRTMELNSLRIQALRELGYTEVTTENSSEVLQKIAEIESRKITN